jgi:GTPase SAR1 family protein
MNTIIDAINRLLPAKKQVEDFLLSQFEVHYDSPDDDMKKAYNSWINKLMKGDGREIKLQEAPEVTAGFKAAIMPVKYGRPKYALDEANNLIGLNLAGLGLEDAQWNAIREVLDREGVRLQALNLRENRLRRLESIPSALELKYLDVRGNPLEEPKVDIIKKGMDGVLRHFQEIARSGVYNLREPRLLIVGQGGSGKTSLKRKLRNVNEDLPKPGDTTRGIEIDTLPLKDPTGEDFTLRVWDFGGQNIQHYAHQFFLTGNCLYVLVHNQREQNTNFQYWLNIIEMLGESSPVIIMQNEVEGHCEPLANAGSILDRFKNVQEPFYQVDLRNAASDKRFEELKANITRIASDKKFLPHFGSTRPNSFLEVRNKLAELAKEKQYIYWSEFKGADVCGKANVKDPNLIDDFADTLTFLGDCLHFAKDLELRNYIFLRPKWIIDALFTLLYHDIVIKNQGLFCEMDTLKIWEGTEYESMHGKLIRLMENFELCYPVADSENKSYIVPQRLPSAGTTFPWAEPEAVKVIYKYKFMPKGIITRLICRMHRKIEDNHVWCDAVIFSQKGGRLFVRERYAEDEIWLEAEGKKKSDLLNLAVEVIDNIHKESKFTNLKVEKLLPCTCEKCLESGDPFYFNFDFLVESLREGEEQEKCQKSRRRIDIREFLARTFENGDEMPSWARSLHEKQDKTIGKLDDIKSWLEDNSKTIIEKLDANQISMDKQQSAIEILEPLLKAVSVKLPEKEKAVVQKINAAPDLKSKLKLAIPIIPLLLSYETELSWEWKKVKSTLRGLLI